MKVLKISIAQPIIGPEELAAVEAVVRSGMLAQGPKVAELEDAFAAYTGAKYGVAVNSGTAALHCALYAAGIGPGDEVITTPYSFIATINAILMVGARPVLVDIEPETFNIDVSKIAAAITPATKAIIPVHLYGLPYDHAALGKLADEQNLKVIEDACQAIGASVDGKNVGNLGDMACFSLYATKNIMCGEGGVITTNDPSHVEAIKRFRQHGMDAQYDYKHLGFNYRLSDLHAAIAVEQLKKVDTFNQARQKNAATLSAGLKDIKDLVLPTNPEGRTHVFHQYTIRVGSAFKESRDALLQRLRDASIGAGVYYPKPLHFARHIADLGYKPGDFPEAERAAETVISLPIHPGVSEADIATIVEVVRG